MISLNNDYYKKTPNPDFMKNENQIYEIKNNLDQSEIVLLTKLNNLRLSLSTDPINIRSVKDKIKEFSEFNNVQNYEYLNSLLTPEKARGSKIPSQVPVPSCSFQLHNSATIMTNSTGNCAFILCPFFLANSTVVSASVDSVFISKFLSTFWVNHDNSLTGNAANANWKPVDLGQVLPPVYTQYRLVSASVQVKYIGRLDAASGMVGGAIILEDLNNIGGCVQTGSYSPSADGTETKNPDIYKYGNFELARDSYYHQEHTCLEGVRMLYFPIDNSYEEYRQVITSNLINVENPTSGMYQITSNIKNGFNWMFYAQGAPESSNCFKVDIYCNFECLPDSSFLNYMPISSYPFLITPEEKKKFILLIQNKPILKLEEENDCIYENQIPNIFLKMIKKFKNGVPGFEKLKAWGLISAIPGLSSGLALAGNMVLNNMNELNNY